MVFCHSFSLFLHNGILFATMLCHASVVSFSSLIVAFFGYFTTLMVAFAVVSSHS